MRKFIIDTDTASDDAVALIMALKSTEIEIKAVTTVAGNVSIEKATRNALMTIETADGQKPPVYMGCAKPLVKPLINAIDVHGHDGMSDCNLIHPSIGTGSGHAVDKIIEIVDNNPYEIELITIGPATNIAVAILKAPDTMKKLKHIYTMGTSGFGPGNTTPVAEFNVYVDAEAFSIMMNFDVPKTIIGLDVIKDDTALNKDDLNLLLASNCSTAKYAVKCTQNLLKYNQKYLNKDLVDLPDAVAMGVAIFYNDIVIESTKCYLYVCTTEAPAYGQVIIDDGLLPSMEHKSPNAEVCTILNNDILKKRLLECLIN